jgi:hypothetical protein
MPLLDHFHPPLHGPRRWEGFHHSWATMIARQLNADALPEGYFAEAEISVGPELEVDVATLESPRKIGQSHGVATLTWAPPRPKQVIPASFAHLEGYEVRIYQELDGAELRAAIELVSPGNKDRAGARRTFAAKCAGYLRQGVSLVVVDVVTARSAQSHAELLEVLEVKGRKLAWESTTGLSAIAYRPVTVRRQPRIEIWPEALSLGKPLPTMPLWLTLELAVPLQLEASYLDTCQSLRISA